MLVAEVAELELEAQRRQQMHEAEVSLSMLLARSTKRVEGFLSPFLTSISCLLQFKTNVGNVTQRIKPLLLRIKGSTTDSEEGLQSQAAAERRLATAKAKQIIVKKEIARNRWKLGKDAALRISAMQQQSTSEHSHEMNSNFAKFRAGSALKEMGYHSESAPVSLQPLNTKHPGLARVHDPELVRKGSAQVLSELRGGTEGWQPRAQLPLNMLDVRWSDVYNFYAYEGSVEHGGGAEYEGRAVGAVKGTMTGVQFERFILDAGIWSDPSVGRRKAAVIYGRNTKQHRTLKDWALMDARLFQVGKMRNAK